MKVSFFAIAALWVGVALAQAPERADHLATLLDLTAEQKTQVQAVLDAEHAKMKAALEQMRADTLAQLKPILTADQLEKFQVLMAERGPPGRPH